MLDFRHRDGSNQLGDEPGGTPRVAYSDYTGYRPVNTWNEVRYPDRWQPLCLPLPPPGATECTGKVQTYLTPQWSRVTPFALTSPGQFRAPGPYPYLDKDGKVNGQFIDQIDKMTQYSKQLDDTRKTYAEYWEDGPGTVTPPGHWNQFAQWVARRDAHTLDEDARMFFALNSAELDASIAAWDGKGHWDSVRPITAVRYVNRGKIIQAVGRPVQGTLLHQGRGLDPVPAGERPGPAVRRIRLRPLHLLRRGRRGADRIHRAGRLRVQGHHRGRQLEGRAGARSRPSRSPCPGPISATPPSRPACPAQYGGLHFEHGDKDARAVGANVGKNAWAKAVTYFNGTAR